MTIKVADACSVEDANVEITVNGVEEAASSQEIVNDTLVVTLDARRELGTYDVAIRVTDGCGNFTTEATSFEVFDDKAPGIICHEGLVVELMPQEGGGAAMAVWATDLIGSPIGDCTGDGPELVDVGAGYSQPRIDETGFSIYLEDSTDVDGDFYVSPRSDESVRSIMLTCDHLDGQANNAVMIRLYVEDGAGNYDFCTTAITLQDNQGSCGSEAVTGEIAGVITAVTMRLVVNVRDGGG